MKLLELQFAFGQFLLHGAGNFDRQVSRQGNLSQRDRIEIYRNAYRHRLRECIESDHQVLATFLGDDLFDRMACAYIDAHQSSSTSLRQYCDHLPEFLMDTEPYCDHPVVHDIAQFERGLLHAFDAPDAVELRRYDLGDVEADAWPFLVFSFHPSTVIHRGTSNAVQIWQDIKAERTPAKPEERAADNWIIFRNDQLLTVFHSLSPVEAAVIETWLGGGTFADGCATALELLEESDAVEQVVSLLRTCTEEGVMRIADSG